tara:strand:- start:10 stop:303 length:294 start_codon:yes stop_codon:yes gene_type:complete
METKDKKKKMKKESKREERKDKSETKNSDNNEGKKIPEDKIIQIPLHLLMRFRNIFEITNAQMHWKTQDLLPVGMIIRDVDRIIGAHIEQPENTDKK